MSATPQRIQLRRTKDWRLQEASLALNGLPAVKVARPTKWGNPYNWQDGVHIGNEAWAKGVAVECYRQWLRVGRGPSAPTDAEIAALRGKNLACFCPLPKPGEPDHCHASILLEIANAPSSATPSPFRQSP